MESIIHGAPLPPRVTAVAPGEDYTLFLTFNNGERRIFDAKPLFGYKVFAPLKNRRFFSAVRVEHGSVAWPNDIDYCPDTLYAESNVVEGEAE